MGKRVPPRVSIQDSIITVVDPSKCQTSIRKIKDLDVQMLIDATPLQLNASNDMDSSTTVSRCSITLHLNANLDKQRKPESNIITILSVGKEIDSSWSINIVRLLLLSMSHDLSCVNFAIEPKLDLPLLRSNIYFSIYYSTVVTSRLQLLRYDLAIL